MKKKYIILITCIIVLIISISIIKIIQIYFTLHFSYDYVIWCNKENTEYINDKYRTNIKRNSIVVCDTGYKNEYEEVEVIKNFSTIFEKKIEVNSTYMDEDLKEKSNPAEVSFRCSFFYILMIIASIFILHVKLIPKLADS